MSGHLFEKPKGVSTRWCSFENPTAGRNSAALENKGGKGHPFDNIKAGETKALLDVAGSGLINRIWMTFEDRSPTMLRSVRIDMFWDGEETPAVSCPVGDFFGIGLGLRKPFESALFSDPEGRSFNCFIPMPFRKSVRITLTNESDKDFLHLYYEVNFQTGVDHSPETLYFHAHWHRETETALGKDFIVLPRIRGNGRFLGCNFGVITHPIYEKAWWGEGELKVWFGDDENPTLCGTGTEDYIGTAWGQGTYAHRTQGSLVADPESRQWAFYRYHTDDPIYFDGACQVAIQTMGGALSQETARLQKKGAPLIPVTIDYRTSAPVKLLLDQDTATDLDDPALHDLWCNFHRSDDWCSTAYFYLDAPGGKLPPLAPKALRLANLPEVKDPSARADG